MPSMPSYLIGTVLSVQTTWKLEGGGGQKSGKIANVIYECPLSKVISRLFIAAQKFLFIKTEFCSCELYTIICVCPTFCFCWPLCTMHILIQQCYVSYPQISSKISAQPCFFLHSCLCKTTLLFDTKKQHFFVRTFINYFFLMFRKSQICFGILWRPKTWFSCHFSTPNLAKT